MMKPRINIITLGVENLERAVKFYEQGLGWTKSKTSSGDIAFFKLNGIVLALYPAHLLAEDAHVPFEKPGFSGVTLAYNTGSEAEVDTIIAEVEKLGATIIKTPQKVFWGGYSSYFRDPEGHLFEVVYSPFTEFDAEGNLDI